VFSGYHLAYSNKTLPGVYVGNVSFSGLNKAMVLEKLEVLDTVLSGDWQLIVGDKTYMVNNEKIGYNFNRDVALHQLFTVGREKNLLESFRNKFISLSIGYHVLPVYDIDQKKYDEFVNNVIENATSEYINSTYKLDENDQLLVVPEVIGYTVSREKVEKALYNKYILLDSTKSEKIALTQVNPEVNSLTLVNNMPFVSDFLTRQFSILYNNQKWIPSKQEKLEIITANNELTINKNNAFLKQVVEAINNPKTVEVFEEKDGKVVKFIPANNGVEVDEKEFYQELRNSIVNPQTTFLQVPVKITEVNKGSNEFGVKELIGSGETTYYHSALNRVFNVNLAAVRVTGILVAPEEVFSFANTVGDVSAATGYKSGYIIYNNKTILGDGGGLCQVSTTLFRAALDAGLPIVSRTGHSYRVSYYEQNSDPGFDATVFVPSVDLKFKNDTGNYILIISESKPDEYYLKYSIYGTNDGRKVSITKPAITSVTPPPGSVYQDDNSLPKGTVKQVEWATWGAKVEFSRTIERQGTVVSQETFKTNYTPWANAFLVGTKE